MNTNLIFPLVTLGVLGLGFLISYTLNLLIFFRGRNKKVYAFLSDTLQQFDSKLEERTRTSDRLLQETITHLQTKLLERSNEQIITQQKEWAKFKEETQQGFADHRHNFDKRHVESLEGLQKNLQKGLEFSSNLIGQRVDKLTEQTALQLKEISVEVDKRLNEGFAKTTETFTDVIKRLALIDEAQKKITELSTNVVSLQEILADKRSRGAFGEIQLSGILRNMLPENNFSLQHTLSNGSRADCILFLPSPTGNLVIDAKFPLESYQKLANLHLAENERIVADKQFKVDIKKHIQDIANKYILPGETADGAIMFIPAEAVFAEIHSHYPDLVEYAQTARVWLVSPSTLMAILTTARAVIKDEATQKQVNLIREHLRHLALDFSRFQTRMDQLAKHIEQAREDVNQVHTSAKKISSRFNKIEQVDLKESLETPVNLVEEIQEEN